MLAQQSHLQLPDVMLAVAFGAVAGDSTTYLIGRRFGPAVFKRSDIRLFRPAYVERTQTFFRRHGGLALVLACFVPVVRTVPPTLAGVGQMPYPQFLASNVLGGALWVGTIPLVGFWMSSLIPQLDRYILLVGGVAVLARLIPAGLELRKMRTRRP